MIPMGGSVKLAANHWLIRYSVYIYIYIRTYVYIYIYIYIYRERERERDILAVVELLPCCSSIRLTVPWWPGEAAGAGDGNHRWNRNPRPQPQTFSKLVFLR